MTGHHADAARVSAAMIETRLTVPIIADKRDLDQLYEHAERTGGPGTRALADELGIIPPSTTHQWRLGWVPCADGSRHLAWYDPNKHEAITAAINEAVRARPDAAEIRIDHGHAWDEWTVVSIGIRPGIRTEATP